MNGLPFFKFYPAQWITGEISLLSSKAQLAFILVMCYYWEQGCKLKTKQIKRIIAEESYIILLDNGIIKSDGENISIKFLDLQLKELVKRHEINVANGRKGGLQTQEINRGLSEASSEAQALRKDKKRKEKIKKDNIIKDKIYTTTDPNLFVDDEIKNLLKK